MDEMSLISLGILAVDSIHARNGLLVCWAYSRENQCGMLSEYYRMPSASVSMVKVSGGAPTCRRCLAEWGSFGPAFALALGEYSSH